MMRLEEIYSSIAELKREDLEAWVDEALVAPEEREGELVLSDMACARIRLICTLHYDMEIEANALPVILDLIDQLHETRGRLNTISRAVLMQDTKIREAVLSRVRGDRKS
jgi:chaperone modulatory protein CbpM